MSIVWYTYPKKVNESFDGTLYQLGKDHKDVEESIKIKVNGTLKKRLFQEDMFIGTLEIDDELWPPQHFHEPLDKLEITFGMLWGGGWIHYWDLLDLYQYGVLVINDDFSELTILKFQQFDELSQNTTRQQAKVEDVNSIQVDYENFQTPWSSEDGFMISAPALNREEALDISKRLMENELADHLE